MCFTTVRDEKTITTFRALRERMVATKGSKSKGSACSMSAAYKLPQQTASAAATKVKLNLHSAAVQLVSHRSSRMQPAGVV